MALEEGAEVAAEEGPTVKMGPINPHNLGGLGARTTLQMGAVEHTGNGASAHTIAAIGLYVPGRTGLSPDLHNSNHNNRTNHPDNWVGSKKKGKMR